MSQTGPLPTRNTNLLPCQLSTSLQIRVVQLLKLQSCESNTSWQSPNSKETPNTLVLNGSMPQPIHEKDLCSQGLIRLTYLLTNALMQDGSVDNMTLRRQYECDEKEFSRNIKNPTQPASKHINIQIQQSFPYRKHQIFRAV